jgi:hypothetical protein
MIILASIHTENFKLLSDITWESNKIKYCEKHDYLPLSKIGGFYGIPIGFEKIAFLLDILNNISECSWIWWTGADSLVTNFNIKIEDKIEEALRDDPNKHIIMTGDFNYKINCDSILLKNSEETKHWLKSILDSLPVYGNHMFAEQQYMLDSFDQFSDIIKLMPQNFMNSYDFKHYGDDENGVSLAAKDVNGERGLWESGDWFIHFPGTGWDNRLNLAKEYFDKIIYE